MNKPKTKLYDDAPGETGATFLEELEKLAELTDDHTTFPDGPQK